MRLLKINHDCNFSLTSFGPRDIPRYAVLSHTWETDSQELTFQDMMAGTGRSKAGYRKIQFCGDQANKNGLEYFWVDSCCIDKTSSAELSEAINSMFRWYHNAARCYAYLSDVSICNIDRDSALRQSRWFTRGWTLQELIAPKSVDFFSKEGTWLGSKESLKELLHDITGIAIKALEDQETSLGQFGLFERLLWTINRQTTIPEDQAYCLLGLFGIHMPLIYGEGAVNASVRLGEEIGKRCYYNKDTEPPLEFADFGAPRRALPAYFYFADENRDKLRAEHPGISPGNIGVLLGEQWKSFGDREKQLYKDKAEADKERYEDWNERNMGRMVATRAYVAAIHAREN